MIFEECVDQESVTSCSQLWKRATERIGGKVRGSGAESGSTCYPGCVCPNGLLIDDINNQMGAAGAAVGFGLIDAGLAKCVPKTACPCLSPDQTQHAGV